MKITHFAKNPKSGEFLNVTNVTTLQVECYKIQRLAILNVMNVTTLFLIKTKKNSIFY